KDSPLLLEQIEVLQHCIRHLKNENSRLKGAQMRMTLASLPPLQVPKISLLNSRQGEGLGAQALYRKANQLLQAVYHMSATTKVLDMKQIKSGSRSSRAVLEVTLLCSLPPLPPPPPPQDEVMREIVQQRPGASVPTDFGTFPSSSFLKAKREKEEGLVLFGKVTFPCEPGQGQVHRVRLTPELLHQLQRHFMS
ncbi:DCTN1 protein, partial [Spizaetus tyrannus]|nr:DCTN1 protein [Spizaetus tyrannus]